MEKDIQHLNIDDTEYETEVPEKNISKGKKEEGEKFTDYFDFAEPFVAV